MGVPSGITRRHNLTANSPILGLSPLLQCLLRLRGGVFVVYPLGLGCTAHLKLHPCVRHLFVLVFPSLGRELSSAFLFLCPVCLFPVVRLQEYIGTLAGLQPPIRCGCCAAPQGPFCSSPRHRRAAFRYYRVVKVV